MVVESEGHVHVAVEVKKIMVFVVYVFSLD
jgi:hypothetical protein